ncbi:MAG: choice-of-anchor Q domain-containing protein [Planctomycetota bacterium]
MTRMTRITASLALACFAGGVLSQQTINVPNDIPTLSLALNPVVSGLSAGDTIELEPGTYSNNGDYTVSVSDITIRGLGATPVTLDQFGTGRIFTADAGVTLTLENLKLTNGDSSGDDGGAVFMADGGTLSIIGCEFENNVGRQGGAVWCVRTELVVEDSTFSGNTATQRGGAISGGGNSANMTIRGSTFASNMTTGGEGGAIRYVAAGLITIENSAFTGNSCTSSGGAVFIATSDAARVTETTFTGNFTQGTASEDTGGLFFSDVSDAVVRDCDFVRNLCPGSGGALRYSNADGTVIDSRFVENEASQAGALLAAGTCDVEVYNCVFTENSALADGDGNFRGGAIAANGGGASEASITIFNSLFDGNIASGAGAIDANTASNIDVINSTFINNVSDEFGSAIWKTSGTADARVFNSVFSDNVPSDDQIRLNSSAGIEEASFNLINGGFVAPGTNNIQADPMFVDASNGDYSLQPDSPAIDAGSSSLYLSPTLSDLAGNPRAQDDPDTADVGEAIIGAVIDMGAFEFTVESGVADCPADQNFDGQLTPADFNAWILNFNAGCD